MSNVQHPAVQRRRLRTELRRVRLGLNLTQGTVADALEWSPSKLIRIESGEVSISPTDLRALTAFYREKGHDFEEGRVDELLDLARASRRQPFAQYRDVLSPDFLLYMQYESSASIIRQFEPLLIPGLLQIEEYALSVLTRNLGVTDSIARRLWEARAERQQILDRDEPPEAFFIIDEAALRRVVGGPRIMRRQLERLRELNQRTAVTLQVVPFSVGAYPVMRAPIVILEFPDAEDDNIVYLENASGETTARDDRTEEPYLGVFFDLEKAALKGDDVDALLDDTIASMK